MKSEQRFGKGVQMPNCQYHKVLEKLLVVFQCAHLWTNIGIYISSMLTCAHQFRYPSPQVSIFYRASAVTWTLLFTLLDDCNHPEFETMAHHSSLTANLTHHATVIAKHFPYKTTRRKLQIVSK